MDLIIEDEYIEAMGAYLKAEGEDIDQKLCQYLSILNQICEEGITEGKTSKALAEFAEQARGLMGIADYGRAAATYCKNYISRVAEEGKDLY